MLRMHLYEVDSTSTYAKELLKDGDTLADFTVVDAEYQTGGRGQKGNSWESERGRNILFSLVCHPTFVSACRQFILSEAIALAVESTLTHRIHTSGQRGNGQVRVKWPNDIYWNDSKISGTLIECNLMGTQITDCIVGTGINVNQTSFTSDAPNPVSLKQVTGQDSDREEILSEVVEQFRSLYEEIRRGNYNRIEDEYKSKLYRKDGFHWFAEPGGEPFEARITDVEPTGHLVLDTRPGTSRRYEFKEVRFLIDR